MPKKKTQARKQPKNKQRKKMPHAKNVPVIGSPAFNKLQKQWYDKLAKDGFEDIEWTDHSTGLGQGTPFLKNSSNSIFKTYKPETEFYFRMVSNFLVHFKGRLTPQDRFILKHHSEGISYRDILKVFNDKFGNGRSLFFIFYRLKKLRAKIEAWNRKHEEGLLNPRQTDFYVAE